MGLPLVHPQKPMFQSGTCRVRPEGNPGSFVGEYLRKRIDERIVRWSPLSGQAAEGLASEKLHHLNAAR
jgi:hypothetical protein